MEPGARPRPQEPWALRLNQPTQRIWVEWRTLETGAGKWPLEAVGTVIRVQREDRAPLGKEEGNREHRAGCC